MSAVGRMIFHGVPETVTVKMIRGGRHFISEEEAIQAALSKGPFFAETELGPSFYVEEPRKLENQVPTHPGLSVYGWRPGAQRNLKERVSKVYQEVIVCGMQKQENKEHIYYVLAEELQTDWPSGIAKYKALPEKVYVTSLRTFIDRLFIMHLPATQDEITEGEASADLRRRDLQKRIEALREEIYKRDGTS